MAKNYIVKSVETGKVVGDFQYFAYGCDPYQETNFGHSHCENCGKAIMWQYVFSRTDSSDNIVLGSECAKNVPKFSHAFKQFPLFKKKVELLARLQGKKLKDIRNSPIVSCSLLDASIQLKDIDAQIDVAKSKENKVKEAKRMEQKHVADAIEPFINSNSFLRSIHSQWSNGSVLTPKQVEVALRVASESKPKIEKVQQATHIYLGQLERIKKFIKGHSNRWYGDSNSTHPTWHETNINMDLHTKVLLISFYNQLLAGKILTEKQLEILAKKEHRYRKQLSERKMEVLA